MSSTVSVAVARPVTCPFESNVISWIYVLPELSEEEAADIAGCKLPKSTVTLLSPESFTNCNSVPLNTADEIESKLFQTFPS